MHTNKLYTKREALKLCLLGGLGLGVLPTLFSFSDREKMIKRTIPATGEALPIVGVGTWRTFDAHNDVEQRKNLKKVLQVLNHYGGELIDSSPMYGSSEKVVGDLTQGLEFQNDFFYATKVWTTGKEAGIQQMQQSFNYMQRKQLDLMQIHNLTDWKTHIKTLRAWKEKEKIRYWGITHYVDSSHRQLSDIIVSERPDFVQFNYSITSRHAEKYLLDIAQENQTAVIINQPFNGGSLFRKTSGKDLPSWAKDIGVESWAQYFLKFILSHKAVTCVIPGTAKPHHMVDNVKAGYGPLPTIQQRNKMSEYLSSI
ncbi:aldo/keto reductase [Eudoraea chungangensis]|uniref:aldo/keto reductase n=1 Tax=Eudoraea chungangensis TaxID=1481905 RepID=UPI0023EC6028|nr:aldo/keto reductase [Eudoraea chungangensis]